MNSHSISFAGLLTWSFQFWRTCFGVISFWMLFAALGRAIQMRVFGPIPSMVHLSLEILVELARILTVLVIIGHGNLTRGAQALGRFFRLKRTDWRNIWRSIRTTCREQWPVLLSNLVLFSLIAFGFNQVNSWIAAHRAVFYGLRDFGFIHEQATSMPIFFFLKNLTVIPLTLIFEYGFFLWLAGKLPRFLESYPAIGLKS